MMFDNGQNNKSLETDKNIIYYRIELPRFISDDIRLWLAQLDHFLELLDIHTEMYKFKYVVSGLPVEVIKKISDIIIMEPKNEPYQVLKRRLIKEYEKTDLIKIKAQLEACCLGSKKPSDLLYEMLEISKGRIQEKTLRELFFNRLPSHISEILTMIGTTDLSKAASLADTAMEFF